MGNKTKRLNDKQRRLIKMLERVRLSITAIFLNISSVKRTVNNYFTKRIDMLKSVDKYPYNFYIDRLLPIIIFLTPISFVSIFVLFHIGFIQRFLIIIILHILFVIPLCYLLSYLRNWDSPNDGTNRYPLLYKYIAIALIYPAISGLYVSLIRYIRLGSIINVALYFQQVPPGIFITSAFALYYTFPLLLRLLSFIRNIREMLWDATAFFFRFIHLKFLKYFIYFKLCEKIYKLHFLFHDVISGSLGGTTWDLKEISIYRRVLSYVYYHPVILTPFVFLFLCIELFLTNGKLYFSIYILFFYPLIFSLFRCFHLFGSNNFILDVCLCDYINYNFTKPRYRGKFWLYMGNPNLWFGFEHQLDPKLFAVVERTIAVEQAIYERFRRFHKDALYRVWGRRFLIVSQKPYKSTIQLTGSPKRWSIRFAGRYLTNKGMRWFHTTRVLKSPLPEKIHPGTILLVKHNLYAVLSLVNHPSIKFSNLQQASKNLLFPKPVSMYGDRIHSNIILEDKSTNLIETLEVNLVMRFKQLVNRGVIIGTYSGLRSHFNHKDLAAMQMRPDFISIWTASTYNYKGILGIDQKTKSPTNFGRNQIITNPITEYEQLLSDYADALALKHPMTTKMSTALENLKRSCNDPETHIAIWAESLDLFPNKWKPPVLLNKSFDSSNLTPEILELIRRSELEITRVSQGLYDLKVSEETGSFPEEVLNNFEGSDIQKLFGDTEY